MSLPVTVAKWAEYGFTIPATGEHEVRLTLRESPGVTMTALELGA